MQRYYYEYVGYMIKEHIGMCHNEKQKLDTNNNNRMFY